MKFKKMISGIAALAIAAGLGCTAFAEDQQLLNENFESDTNVFGVTSAITAVENGTHIYDSALDTNYNKVLLISDGEATATFDSDAVTEGNQPYAIASGEEIRVEFDTLQGWIGSGADVVITLNNSKGEEIVSYTYNWGSCEMTALSIGGVTPSGFSAFNYQSAYTSGSNANGWSGGSKKQAYQDEKDYNPHTTITINGDGYVETNFKKAVMNVDNTYSVTLPSNVTKDIASLNITYTGSNADNTDRSFAFDNLVITKSAQTATMVNYTVNYVCDGETVRTERPAGAVGTKPTIDMETFYSEDENDKYICISSDVGDKTVSAELVVTVVVEKAQKYDVTVVPSTNNDIVITSDTIFEGDTFEYAFPAYIVDETGKVVAQNTTNITAGSEERNYKGSIVPTKDETVTITYAPYTGEAYFFEAEDVITDKTTYESERLSGGTAKRGIQLSAIEFFEATEAGWYTVTTSGATNGYDKGSGMYIYKNDSDTQVDYLDLNYATVNNILTQKSKPIELQVGDKILVQGAESNSILDYILVEKAAPTITDVEKSTATLTDDNINNMTIVSEGVTDKPAAGTEVTSYLIKVANYTEGVPSLVIGGETLTPSGDVEYAYTGEDGATYFVIQTIGFDDADKVVFGDSEYTFTTAAE